MQRSWPGPAARRWWPGAVIWPTSRPFPHLSAHPTPSPKSPPCTCRTGAWSEGSTPGLLLGLPHRLMGMFPPLRRRACVCTQHTPAPGQHPCAHAGRCPAGTCMLTVQSGAVSRGPSHLQSRLIRPCEVLFSERPPLRGYEMPPRNAKPGTSAPEARRLHGHQSSSCDPFVPAAAN